MTNKEILEKVIAKAIDDGYIPDGITNITSIKPTIRNGQAWVRFFNNEGQEVIQDLEHITFNHDFAKALWGEEEHDSSGFENDMFTCTKCGVIAGQEGSSKNEWQFHLQQMVIAEDPIKYLGENI